MSYPKLRPCSVCGYEGTLPFDLCEHMEVAVASVNEMLGSDTVAIVEQHAISYSPVPAAKVGGRWQYDRVDQERWGNNDELPTKAEAIEQGRLWAKEEGLDQFEIGEVQVYSPIGIDVEDILGEAQDNAYDEIGEASDEWLTNVPDAEKKLLYDGLNIVFRKWLMETGNMPQFYAIVNMSVHDTELIDLVLEGSEQDRAGTGLRKWRKVKVLNTNPDLLLGDPVWNSVLFQELKDGDTFRLYDSYDKKLVKIEDGTKEYVAIGAPYRHPATDVLCINYRKGDK